MDHGLPMKKNESGESMSQIPMAQEKKVYTVTGKENFDEIEGYGQNDSMAGMMNLMMIEGSGMQEMKMTPMKEDATDSLALGGTVEDPGNEMTINHSDHGAKTDAISALTHVTVTPNPPIVGDNKIEFLMTDKNGKVINGMKLKTLISMVKMDMGASSPQVKDEGEGHYSVKANFSMAGQWIVKIIGSKNEEFIFNAGSKKPWRQK
jgi:hypothetical protein